MDTIEYDLADVPVQVEGDWERDVVGDREVGAPYFVARRVFLRGADITDLVDLRDVSEAMTRFGECEDDDDHWRQTYNGAGV